MMGCTGTGDTQDVAQANHPVNASFDQTKSLADSLYSCMQFRDAYDLYLQLLDNKEAEADSEKKLDLLNALCNTSELAGHKAEQTKWLEQLIDRRMALAKIAVECGFNSSTYFSSRFRQHFGMSPTEFRKEALQQGEF